MNAAAARDRAIITGYQGPKVRIMEVCGAHTHEIFRLGIRSLLSERDTFCPVLMPTRRAASRCVRPKRFR